MPLLLCVQGPHRPRCRCCQARTDGHQCCKVRRVDSRCEHAVSVARRLGNLQDVLHLTVFFSIFFVAAFDRGRFGDVGFFERVVTAGGSVALTDSLGRNALHWSVICRQFEVIGYLLQTRAVDVAAADREVCCGGVSVCDGWSVIHQEPMATYLPPFLLPAISLRQGRSPVHFACAPPPHLSAVESKGYVFPVCRRLLTLTCRSRHVRRHGLLD